MTHFAVAISSGPSDSIASSDVQGRSVSCLKLSGTVFFPYTLAQLVGGVTISIPVGSYHFAIVGYSDTAASYSSVATMFSGSPALKSFLIAEGDFNTAATKSVTLSSTYVAATAPDLIVTCPVPGVGGRHVLARVGTDPVHLRRPNASWIQSLIIDNPTSPSLVTDSVGAAHLGYALTSGIDEMKYANDVSGSFATEQAFPLSGSAITAIAIDNGSPIVLFANPANTEQAVIRRRAGLGSWSPQAAVMSTPSASGGFNTLRLASAPGDLMYAAGTFGLAGTGVIVASRDAGGTWTDHGEINTAGAEDCTFGGVTDVRLKTDAAGKAHIVYRCESIAGTHLGYLSNRSGSWQTQALTPGPLAFTYGGLAFDIDPSGQMHVLFGAGTLLFYFQGDTTSGLFTGPNQVLDVGIQVGDVAIKAFAAGVLTGLYVINSAGLDAMYPFDKNPGWSTGSLVLSSASNIIFISDMY